MPSTRYNWTIKMTVAVHDELAENSYSEMLPRATIARGAGLADDRTDQLRALEQMIEHCRNRAVDFDLPELAHLLLRAEQSLSDHAARSGPPQIPRGPALSVPRQRIVRH
ncbi:MAG: hypothetical protein ACRYGP_33175 [Janthinobacterium lividum]